MSTIHKGDVLVVDLTVSSGYEQSGVRPAIAVSSGELPGVVIVVPLTSTMEALRFPNTLAVLPTKNSGLEKESIALVFHVRSIDKRRVINVIGKVDVATRKKIDAVLKKILHLS
ncbi:type II toxin-antitoxin system PemK/MazF family toxin [Candidatus Kaiserbacteria bacterium]|nr:type II toxin-antitoxin system PemK/MazF family toxin [Candidatus Kaiserbacteria bacterium]